MNEPLFPRSASPGDDPTYAAILDPVHATIRHELEVMWAQYHDLATAHWRSEFPRPGCTHQRFWEMYLSVSLRDAGLAVQPLPNDAPDVRVDLADGRPVWFEAVAADGGAAGNPNSVPESPQRPPGVVHVTNLPEEQIVLRLTSAIDAKIKQRAKRLARGIVKENEAYVIAVNAAKVPKAFAGTDLPFPLRAVFPIGHQQVSLNRDTLEVVDVRWSARFGIPKKVAPGGKIAMPTEGGSPTGTTLIPTTLFANEEHAGISAIVYSTAHAGWHAGSVGKPWGSDLIVVHNPFARSALPQGFFPRGREYVAAQAGDGTFEVRET